MCLAQGHDTLTPVGIEPRTSGFGLRIEEDSDSESRGPGFDPHRCQRVVSLSKTH